LAGLDLRPEASRQDRDQDSIAERTDTESPYNLRKPTCDNLRIILNLRILSEAHCVVRMLGGWADWSFLELHIKRCTKRQWNILRAISTHVSHVKQPDN